MRRVAIRLCLLGLLMASSLLTSLASIAEEITGEMLIYRVERPGEAPFINRFLVTENFLRLDQGEADAGFILFDRALRVIYSVNPAEASILVIDPADKPDRLNDKPKVSLISEERSEVPNVAGVKPTYWRLEVDGSSCREAFVLPGVFTSAMEVYADYLKLLALQQAEALGAVPDEFRDPCDSVVYVYAAEAFVEKGLPLKLWDGKGYSETLLDYKSHHPLGAEPFTLPENYQRVPMGFAG